VTTPASSIAPVDGGGRSGRQDLGRLVPDIALRWDHEAPGRSWRVVEGSLCFADISGFTKLSDRLARQGRRGAEELVDTLDRVFGDMLDVAMARGADLLKFGGDALLLFYRGPDHELRAASGAVAMRAALRKAKEVPTSVGRLDLSMSVGVHSGPLDLFLVGKTHRELLVLGPTASMTAHTESIAQRGQIVVSEATAAALPRGSVRPNPDGGMLLRWRSDPLAGTVLPPGADAALADPRGLLPPTLVGALSQGRIEPQHRTATIGFFKYTGTDRLLAEEGPDDLALRLEATLGRLQYELEAESATLLHVDIDVDGGKFFIGSGTPVSLEDDAGRLLRVGRTILEAGLPLPIQIGVKRGHVFTAEIGSASRSTYSAMGDTTNTAARFAGKAPVGHLYTCPVTLERSRSVFGLGPPLALVLKGKPEPVTAFDVGPMLEDRVESTRSTLPFVGRDAELAAVERVVADRGVITVRGAPGVGKSRLLREALDRRPGREVVTVRGEQFRATTSYRALRDPVRVLLGIHRGSPEAMAGQLSAIIESVAPDLAPYAALIGDVVAVPVPPSPAVEALAPEFRPDRTADVVIDLLARLLPRLPVVVIDDAQWIDQASAHLLGRLATIGPEAGLTLVVLRRVDETGGFTPGSGETVLLSRLADDVIRELIHTVTEAAPPPPHVVDDLVRQADGSPAYVEEVLRSVTTAGSDTVPLSLQAALDAQIDGLAPLPRQVLRYASVLGRSFRLPVLEGLLGDDALPRSAWAQEGLEQFLVDEPPDRIRFRSGLLRDAAYAGLAYRVRVALHQRVREILEAEEPNLETVAAVLAEHSHLAEDHERTWRYSVIAARQAAATGSNGDAIRLYERGLEAGRRLGLPPARRAEGWAELGDVRERAGLYDEAHEAFRQAGARSDDPRARAVLHLRRARCRERTGRYLSAHRELSIALRSITNGDDADTTRLLAGQRAQQAAVFQAQQRPLDARAAAAEALELAVGVEDLETAALASEILDWAERWGGLGDGRVHLEQAKSLYERLGDATGLARVSANAGVASYFAGDWDAALTLYRQSKDALFASGDVVQAAAVAANLGEILINRNRLDDAEAELSPARRTLRAAGLADFTSFVEYLLARVSAARGRLDEANEQLSAVLHDELAAKRYGLAIEVASHLADCLTELGRPEDALATLESTIAAATNEQSVVVPAIARARARALAALGRWDESLEQLEVGLADAEQQGLAYDTFVLLSLQSAIASGSGSSPSPGAEERILGLRDRLGIA
jgi:class 3 adenylate cyclase/tetratricopeptide (TPR) repeat protein